MRSLAWYAKRLRVMRPGEVLHRVGEQYVLKTLQIKHRFRRISASTSIVDHRRFSFCDGFASKLPELPWSFETNGIVSDALLSGKVNALGCDWVWRPEDAVWHQAPDTHMVWPQFFFGRVPYHPGNPYGDIRIAWEPSRLQHLIALALLARGAQPAIRERAVALLSAQLLSWVDANPFLTGIHYVSAMECGLRILAVCHAMDLARETRLVPDSAWNALTRLVRAHAEFIGKRVSTHSSAGNHTIAEAAALVYVGVLFPEMAGADRWKTLGLSLLEQEADRQILPDGGGAEQAWWYQWFIVDLYGLVVTLLRHRQHSVPGVIYDAYHRGRGFLSAFADTPRGLPQIGDGDQGYALSPFLRLSQPNNAWTQGVNVFDDAGYSVIRAGDGERARLIFDHGPLGLAPCYGHGHADALSVLFRLGRQEILIDPGTYTYNGDPRWRAYFRGTSAHNTVTVDDLDQAVQETAFLWSHPFDAERVRFEQASNGVVRVLACHDGYARRLGVTHWRAVVFQPPGCWLIWDRLTGARTHRVRLHWHLGIEPIRRAGRYLLQAKDRTVHLAVDGGDQSLHRGETD
ncbi:MAG TPA: alginate lyase family protein, partial [Nitrospirales bacterium]|nr:alginate lyase family protein [Nitrospirales bacterium]